MQHRLVLLGGLGLEAGDGHETPGIRRRALALLAILAAAGPQGVSRETILLYLWPDSTATRGRNSLSQALMAIRRRLGDDAIEGTTELHLNSNCFWCDLWEFRDMLREARELDAVRLYGGEFLHGFALPGMEEFAAWAEQERQVLRRRALEALRILADRARAAGEQMAEATWSARAAELEPWSATATVRWMRALADAGDQARAIEVAREYAARLRRDLGAEPEPEVTALAADLTEDLALEPKPASHRTHTAAVVAAAEPGNSGAPAAGRHTRAASWWVRWVALAAVLGTVLGFSLSTAVPLLRPPPPAAPAPDVGILVFPFAERGVSLGTSFGRGLSELLAGNLDGVGYLRAAGSEAGLPLTAGPGVAWSQAPGRAATLAAEQGARLFVVGEAIGSADSVVRVEALLYDRAYSLVRAAARIRVQASARGALEVADSLAVGVLLAAAPALPGLGLRRADLTTRSLPALHAYVEGQIALRDGRYGAAIAALRRAAEADTGFAAAYYRLSVAADWAGYTRLSELAADRAARLARRLPDETRYVMEGLRALRAGEPARAEELYRQAINEKADDAEAWYGLADLLFRTAPLRGQSVALARPAFERALALNPSDVESLVHLARIAAIEGRRADADRLIARARALTADSNAVELRASRTFALVDAPGMQRATWEVIAQRRMVDAATVLRVPIYLHDLDGSEIFARRLTTPGHSANTRAFGLRLLAQSALARGHVQAAQRMLDRAGAAEAAPSLELKTVYAAFPSFAAARNELVDARAAAERWNGIDSSETLHRLVHEGLHPAIRLHRLGVLSARLHEYETASAAVDSLFELPGSDRQRRIARTLAWSIRAWVARERGAPGAVLACLDNAEWPVAADALAEEASDRFLRAEALAATGRVAEALGWLGSIAERATYELPYRAPAELMEARILDRGGQRAHAADHYRRLIALWQNADAPLQPVVRQARARLRVLQP